MAWPSGAGFHSTALPNPSAGAILPIGMAIVFDIPLVLLSVQLLLGHTKMDSTVRYLGVDLDDALTLSEGIDL